MRNDLICLSLLLFTSAKTREEETVNIEHVLQHHRQLHDEMTNDLSKMAKQLKMNTQQFGNTLNKDNKVR